MPRTLTIPTLGDLTGHNGRGVLAGIVIGAFGLAVIGPILSPGGTHAVDAQVVQPGQPEHTISVSGTGTVKLSPDVADLRVGVAITRTTVKEARAAAAEAMTNVIAALHKAGVADRDIQTSTLYLQPTYDYKDGGQGRITGYQLQNMVQATIRDLDQVGPAVDGATAGGATSIDGITFRVDDPAAAERQARTSAMGNAKAKADALAAAAGVSITGVSSVSEDVSPTPFPEAFKAAGAAPSARDVATPIQPGQSEITVSVSVVYRIG